MASFFPYAPAFPAFMPFRNNGSDIHYGILNEVANNKVHSLTPFHKYGLLAVILLIATTTYGALFRTRQRLVSGIPVVGGTTGADLKESRERFIHDGPAMLLEGYSKSNNGFFYVPSKLGERLMLPTRYLNDLKNAPTNEVDFVATFFEVRLATANRANSH